MPQKLNELVRGSRNFIIFIIKPIDKIKPNPLMRCFVRIMGNKLAIKPSLEDIQIIIKKAIIVIQTSMKAVTKWSKRGRRKTILNDNKESESETVNPSINVKEIDEDNMFDDKSNFEKKLTKENAGATGSVTSDVESQSSQVWILIYRCP